MNNSVTNPIAQKVVKVFLGGLPKKTKDVSLKHHLSKYGQIHAISTKRKRTDGECLGYGEATVSEETYEQLIQLGSSKFMGRRITFGPYLDGNQLKSHLEKLNSKRIFVRNIPKNSKPKSLEKLFSSVGKVETAYLRNVPGSRKPIGVILFTSPKEAESAAKLINKDVEGVFRKMNATYKFVTNFKKKVKRQRKNSGGSNPVQARKSFQPSPSTRNDQVRPGSSKYSGYRAVHMNHHRQNNIVLNKPERKHRVYEMEQPVYSQGPKSLNFEMLSFESNGSDCSNSDFQRPSFESLAPIYRRKVYDARTPPQRQRYSFFVQDSAWNNNKESFRF